MTLKLAVDIGGTFTDFALVNEETGSMAIYKQLTTPHDPAECVLDGASKLLSIENVSFESVGTIVHGTTLVTNAVIERKGAVAGMLTTKGFRDILDIALERRYDLFDLRLKFPKPFIPRSLRFEVNERIAYDGKVRQGLDMNEVGSIIDTLVTEHKIESLAVCLLHSYINPAHEKQIHSFAKDRFPGLFISMSSDIFPFMREYERFTTTTANAFVQPLVDRYLVSLETGFRQNGFQGKLFIMTSSGGTVTPETARHYPVRMLESGPAAGVLMSAYIGRRLDFPNLLSYDMGGTTAKGSIIRKGMPRKEYALEVARMHEFKQGSGLPIKAPVIDMIEIGAGGGSIAEVDERGLIRVGPHSSGADPGPACYGLSGEYPTLTDADLVLGYLNPDYFVGGRMALDRTAAERVIINNIGKPLGLDLTNAAWGIHEIINEDTARAFRVHASERGVDYRNCSMVAFGGSGPVHALRIARKLKIPRVIFPLGAGVFSAFGLLVSPLSFDSLRSQRIALEDLTPDLFGQMVQSLTDEATGFLRQAGVDNSGIHITRRLDMRYQGQGFEIEVRLPDEGTSKKIIQEIPALFARCYKKVYTINLIDEPLEIVNWKVEATGPLPEVGGEYRAKKITSGDSALKGSRQVYFPDNHAYSECPVYDRYLLKSGAQLKGPALLEERESTCVIGYGEIVKVDAHLNLIAEIKEACHYE